jgi:sulfite reductase alpha subunit-like flavoprotein
VRPDLPRLLELIPRLGPRHFSIASALEAHPSRVQLLIAMVTYKTQLNVSKVGVCSAWLTSLDPRDPDCPPVPVWTSASLGSLRLPKNPATPVIAVGPGTGVAPFRSFFEYRQLQRQQQPEQQLGDSVLFFGSRNQRHDYYFGPQWAELLADGTLSGLYTAFSRDRQDGSGLPLLDGEGDGSKPYVQQRIKEAGAVLWPLLRGGDANGGGAPPAMFYVAGSAKNMPVREAHPCTAPLEFLLYIYRLADFLA